MRLRERMREIRYQTSDVRLRDKETIDFETVANEWENIRGLRSEVRLREDTLVRNLKSKVFKSY